MMSDNEIAMFNDSLDRCRKNPRFLDRFYEYFVGSSEAVAAKFAQTDFLRQKIMLISSLAAIRSFATRREATHPELDHIAEIHSRTRKDVPAELYTLWLESLMRAVRECDPCFDLPTEAAWRTVLGLGIAYMTTRY